MQVLHLGPIALPMSFVLLVATAALGLAVGRFAGASRASEVEGALLRVLVAAVVVSRLAFVWTYRQAYLATPLDVLDIRDGGWNAPLGLAAAWLAALALGRRKAELRRPIWAATGAASAAWIAGSIVLAMSPVPVKVPAIAATDLDGRPVSLASFAGRPLVVNLWATWCGPCRREMPLLGGMQAARPDLHVVFLNQGESAAEVRRYLAAANLALSNVLLDGKGLAGVPYGGMLPTTLFFDAQGTLVSVRTGELSAASLAQRLDEIAASGASRPHE